MDNISAANSVPSTHQNSYNLSEQQFERLLSLLSTRYSDLLKLLDATRSGDAFNQLYVALNCNLVDPVRKIYDSSDFNYLLFRGVESSVLEEIISSDVGQLNPETLDELFSKAGDALQKRITNLRYQAYLRINYEYKGEFHKTKRKNNLLEEVSKKTSEVSPVLDAGESFLSAEDCKNRIYTKVKKWYEDVSSPALLCNFPLFSEFTDKIQYKYLIYDLKNTYISLYLSINRMELICLPEIQPDIYNFMSNPPAYHAAELTYEKRGDVEGYNVLPIQTPQLIIGHSETEKWDVFSRPLGLEDIKVKDFLFSKIHMSDIQRGYIIRDIKNDVMELYQKEKSTQKESWNTFFLRYLHSITRLTQYQFKTASKKDSGEETTLRFSSFSLFTSPVIEIVIDNDTVQMLSQENLTQDMTMNDICGTGSKISFNKIKSAKIKVTISDPTKENWLNSWIGANQGIIALSSDYAMVTDPYLNVLFRKLQPLRLKNLIAASSAEQGQTVFTWKDMVSDLHTRRIRRTSIASTLRLLLEQLKEKQLIILDYKPLIKADGSEPDSFLLTWKPFSEDEKKAYELVSPSYYECLSDSSQIQGQLSFDF